MTTPSHTDRRTVLKTLGTAVAVGAGVTGTAAAHRPGPNGQIPVFLTWGDHEIWELVDAEPPTRDRDRDAEGDCSAHSPLYLIAPVGGPHSPQFGDFDQVVPVPGGPNASAFSAQWHPKLVLDEAGHPVNTDQDGNLLTSAARIDAATNVRIAPLAESTVFTCPVRPHHGD